MSSVAPDLPLAATAPALCGPLQMMPAGGADTGVTAAATNGGNEMGMIALGGGLLAAAGSAYAVRRSMTAGR
ncbi:hypothetical protein [Arthrobacter sp. H14]|uniref:hypothetical protein n=1 Tax=Arthrobacter sp. H14 TaxID=1312959 RepID=UPI0012DF6909|nr:hypothetical protein [Arthrobacter sp. H14]